MRVRIVAPLVVVILLGAAGWYWQLYRRHRGSGTPAATVSLQWSGRFRGRTSMPAQIRWCPVNRIATLEAISGDTGFVLVMYPREALISGTQALIEPDLAMSAARPAATAALRWLEHDSVVAGFRSQSGSATTTVQGTTASGSVNARMHSVLAPDTLAVQVQFRNLPVITTAAGCS